MGAIEGKSMAGRSMASEMRASRRVPSIGSGPEAADAATVVVPELAQTHRRRAPEPEPGARAGSTGRVAKSARHHASGIATLAFSALVLAMLGIAYQQRHEQHIVPETGFGYWLGVTGSVMMLLLMLYPLRKSMPRLAVLGRIASWFKMHMVFGIFGPALVVIHSNFALKSANATVAMMAMLTVVASGIIGRYLYAKLHKGLYGRKAEVKGLLEEAEALSPSTGVPGRSDGVWSLKEFEAAILDANTTTFESLKLLVSIQHATRSQRTALLEDVKADVNARALRERWDRHMHARRLKDAEVRLDRFLSTVRQAAGSKFYSRLFSWWHVLHMPLYIMLILAALVHVLAVHLY